MDNKQKLLAEQYLYTAASRFFDEEPTIVEAKAEDGKSVISEKTLYTKDGTPVNVPDDVYNTIFKTSSLGVAAGDEGDEDPDALQTETGVDFDAKANAAQVAATNRDLAKQNAAKSFGDRASAGQAIYDALAEEINTVVKEFANEQIEKGRITYDEDLGEWVIGNDDPKAIKQLLSILEVKVYQEVIKPAKATLKKGQQDALLATFHKTFTNPAHVKDGTPAFKGAKLLLKKTLNGMKESTGATETFDVNSEGLAEAFYKACNTVLTEMYAKRYDVEKEEASQMFILRDTPAAESAED